MQYAIVGCGLIGKKRAVALQKLGRKIIAVFDPNQERANSLASSTGAFVCTGLEDLAARAGNGAWVVATSNHALSEVAAAGLRAGNHCLVEKPAGRSVAELRGMEKAAAESERFVAIGFNHRFHPAISRAQRLLAQGELGPILHVRARYGHGGRLGYEKEWRANPALSGGGELIDQGVHLIDLAQWFLGPLTLEFGRCSTEFWPMAVDDNAYLSLLSSNGQRAWLHASCTEWKNLFDFEIFCQRGKLQVFGLGGSYGPEELRTYTVPAEMGVPALQVETFSGNDDSWAEEIVEFEKATKGEASRVASLTESIRTLQIVEDVYANPRVPPAPAWRSQFAPESRADQSGSSTSGSAAETCGHH